MPRPGHEGDITTYVKGLTILDADRAFHNNAMPVTDHLGGGENIRSKDYLAISHSPAVFLCCLVLDGVFDRFPGLRGGSIEQAGPELFMFSTDYPHPKGGRDPLGKFEETLVDISAADQGFFFAGNMSRLIGAMRLAGG